MIVMRVLLISCSIMKTSFNIGFLDSGIGGLSILAEVEKTYPEHNFFYLADQDFFPYGDKQNESLLKRLKSLVPEYIEKNKLKLLVIACNTASTAALALLRGFINIPIIGVVPAIKPAAEQSRQKRLGILATPATVKSKYTKDLLAKYASNCKVTLIGSSDMVQIAEHKAFGHSVDMGILKQIVQPFAQDQVDAVVLACTHFPFLQEELTSILPNNVKLIDSAKGVSRQVGRIIAGLDSRNCQHKVKHQFASTANKISTPLLAIAYDRYKQQLKASAN